MWNVNTHSINRIVRKLGQSLCATAYALHVEFALTPKEISVRLAINVQTAASAIRAGRALNDNDAFNSFAIRVAVDMVAVIVRRVWNAPAPVGVPVTHGQMLMAGLLHDRAEAERMARLYAHAG